MLKRRVSLFRFLCIGRSARRARRALASLEGPWYEARRALDRSEHVGAIFSNVLHFAQQQKLHALSPPLAARYALGIIHIQNLYQLSRNLHK